MTQRPFDFIGHAFDTRWQHVDAGAQHGDLQLEGDVVVIGTGAGGGTAAYCLARAGLDVILLEEGPLRTARDFKLQERSAYPELYQEAAARKTADKAIAILQGRAVGGSTLVNWTTSLRTPEPTLDHWHQRHGWSMADAAAMAPWFADAEARHGVMPWPTPPNPNNAILGRGLAALGGQGKVVPRNVSGCWNLGACGLGCPTNAKQSALVALLPTVLDRGGAAAVAGAGRSPSYRRWPGRRGRGAGHRAVWPRRCRPTDQRSCPPCRARRRGDWLAGHPAALRGARSA